MKEYYRVEAKINLDAICTNIKEVRDHIHPDTKIMAVIKADGYGHGAVPIAHVLDPLVDAYAVAIIQEAVQLRKNGITKPILILGYTAREQYPMLLDYDITQTVYEEAMAQELSKLAVSRKRTIKIHIKVETGMGRIGFLPNEANVEQIKRIMALPNVCVEGIFTHIACADCLDKTSANQQIMRYDAFMKQLEQVGIQIPIHHISNSASIIDLPQINYNMVRSGIITYGLYPSDEVNKKRLRLVPAMELVSRVAYVKELEAGWGVGYGSTFITKKKTRIATIPVGYADGYPRQLSNKGRVLIHGQSAPIIGRICMDQFMVDVSEIDGVQENDLVTLIGKDGDACIPVEEMANLAGSFNYEFVCDVGKRIPRVFFYQGKKVGTLDFYDCDTQSLEWNI